MDRAQLFKNVLADLNRQDKADLLPEWLRSTEFRINQTLRDDNMVTRAFLPVTEKLFRLPPDYITSKTVSLQKGGLPVNGAGDKRGNLIYMPADEVDSGVREIVMDQPYYYTVRGKYIELVGWNNTTPDYQIQLWYYAKLPPLIADTDSTWLLEDAPHIYKSGMLNFGFTHLMEPDTAQGHLAMMAGEIEVLNARTEENKIGSGPLIARPAPRIGGKHS